MSGYIIFLTCMIVVLPQVYKNKEFNIFLFTVLAGIICGLRNPDNGVDTQNYYAIYHQLSSMGSYSILADSSDYEIGFRFLAYLVSVFSSDPSVFIFFTSFITSVLIGFFIYYNTDEKYYWIACFLFVCLGMYSMLFNIIRQYLAIAVACNFFTFMQKDKYIHALIILVISILFHNSLIIMLPIFVLLVLARKMLEYTSNKYQIVILFIAIPIALYLLFFCFSDFMVENFYTYFMYFSSQMYSEATEKLNLMSASIEVGYLALIFISIKRAENINVMKKVVLLSVLLMFSFYSFILMSTVSLIFYRLEFIFSIYVCILASTYFSFLSNNLYKKMLLLIVLLGGSFSLWWILITSYNGVK